MAPTVFLSYKREPDANFSESQIHANLTPNPSPLGGEA
jgi:hypothetical protein